jgi:hypothetical protein
MKNFLSNKNIRRARLVLTFMFSLLLTLTITTVVANQGETVNYGNKSGIEYASEFSAIVLAFVMTINVASRFKFSERRFFESSSMFTSCIAIDADITADCPITLTSGVNANFYIANKDDILSITVSGASAHLVTDIVMKSTKKFFSVGGQLQSTEPKVTMVAGKYVNQYEHELNFLVFKIDAASRNQLAKMKDGNLVCIVENNSTGTAGDTKWELYGSGTGLKGALQERTPNDAENLGAFSVGLKTAEYARESKLPMLIYDTDAATTEILIASLLVAAP